MYLNIYCGLEYFLDFHLENTDTVEWPRVFTKIKYKKCLSFLYANTVLICNTLRVKHFSLKYKINIGILFQLNRKVYIDDFTIIEKM